MWLFGSSGSGGLHGHGRGREKYPETLQRYHQELRRLTERPADPPADRDKDNLQGTGDPNQNPNLSSPHPHGSRSSLSSSIDPQHQQAAARGAKAVWTIHIEDRHIDLVVENIRSIAELLVRDDSKQKGETNFDTVLNDFIECQTLQQLVAMAGDSAVPRQIKIQILQTFSILFQNISTEISIYSLMSGNHVNALIETSFDLHDDEILAYYCTLLKGLALRLTAKTAPFYINNRVKHVPLYTEAVKLFAHREGMVRTAVQTLILSVFQVEEPQLQKYILERHVIFTYMACWLRDQWTRVERFARTGRSGEQSIQTVLEEHDDYLLFLEDILRLKPPAYADGHGHGGTGGGGGSGWGLSGAAELPEKSPTSKASREKDSLDKERSPGGSSSLGQGDGKGKGGTKEKEKDQSQLQEVLLHRLFEYAFFPCLLRPLVEVARRAAPQSLSAISSSGTSRQNLSASGGSREGEGGPTPSCSLSPSVALFLWNRILSVASLPTLLVPLVKTLLLPRIPPEWVSALEGRGFDGQGPDKQRDPECYTRLLGDPNFLSGKSDLILPADFEPLYPFISSPHDSNTSAGRSWGGGPTLTMRDERTNQDSTPPVADTLPAACGGQEKEMGGKGGNGKVRPRYASRRTAPPLGLCSSDPAAQSTSSSGPGMNSMKGGAPGTPDKIENPVRVFFTAVLTGPPIRRHSSKSGDGERAASVSVSVSASDDSPGGGPTRISSSSNSIGRSERGKRETTADSHMDEEAKVIDEACRVFEELQGKAKRAQETNGSGGVRGDPVRDAEAYFRLFAVEGTNLRGAPAFRPWDRCVTLVCGLLCTITRLTPAVIPRCVLEWGGLLPSSSADECAVVGPPLPLPLQGEDGDEGMSGGEEGVVGGGVSENGGGSEGRVEEGGEGTGREDGKETTLEGVRERKGRFEESHAAVGLLLKLLRLLRLWGGVAGLPEGEEEAYVMGACPVSWDSEGGERTLNPGALTILSVRCLCRTAIEIFCDPFVLQNAALRNTAVEEAERALRAVAKRVQRLGSPRGELVDTFMEAWVWHKSPPLDCRAVSRDFRVLSVPLPAPLNRSGTGSGGGGARGVSEGGASGGGVSAHHHQNVVVAGLSSETPVAPRAWRARKPGTSGADRNRMELRLCIMTFVTCRRLCRDLRQIGEQQLEREGILGRVTALPERDREGRLRIWVSASTEYCPLNPFVDPSEETVLDGDGDDPKAFAAPPPFRVLLEGSQFNSQGLQRMQCWLFEAFCSSAAAAPGNKRKAPPASSPGMPGSSPHPQGPAGAFPSALHGSSSLSASASAGSRGASRKSVAGATSGAIGVGGKERERGMGGRASFQAVGPGASPSGSAVVATQQGQLHTMKLRRFIAVFGQQLLLFTPDFITPQHALVAEHTCILGLETLVDRADPRVLRLYSRTCMDAIGAQDADRRAKEAADRERGQAGGAAVSSRGFPAGEGGALVVEELQYIDGVGGKAAMGGGEANEVWEVTVGFDDSKRCLHARNLIESAKEAARKRAIDRFLFFIDSTANASKRIRKAGGNLNNKVYGQTVN